MLFYNQKYPRNNPKTEHLKSFLEKTYTRDVELYEYNNNNFYNELYYLSDCISDKTC
jgi:hypothetical protein